MEAPAYILGRHHDGLESDSAMAQIEQELFFFSYRRGFQRIEGTMQISDTGWGCSHRSAQMLLAQALSRLRSYDRSLEADSEEDLTSSLRSTAPRGRRSSLVNPNVGLRQSAPVSARHYMSSARKEIIECFADSPAAWFSIHNLTLTAARLTDKKAGDWLGPSTVSVALRASVNANQPWGMRVCVADAGVIYRTALPADSPVLILVPLRLGLDAINPLYLSLIQAVLRCPLCVGIVGGRESSSFYFFGYAEEQVVFLDPHISQSAFEKGVTPFPMDTFKAQPQWMPLSNMDPSMTVGFFCAGASQVDELQEFLRSETADLPFTLSLEQGASPSTAPVLSETPTSLGDDWVAL